MCWRVGGVLACWRAELAKHRLDLIDGNTNSYAKCLNDPKRMNSTRESNEVVASAANVTSEVSEEKARKKERKEREAADKVVKKAASSNKRSRSGGRKEA